MRRPLLLLLGFLVLVPPLLAQTPWTRFPGMKFAGRIARDANGIAQVTAFTDYDAAFLNGWVHAQDRLFEMDENRRTASGTLAELLGAAALPTDVQLRSLGLRRAAQLSQLEYSADVTQILEAYSAGVNAYVAAHGLPAEYRAIEVTRWEPWTPLDSIAVAKLLAFGLSFDLDTENTVNLLTYQAAGQQLGVNGTVLFFEDLFRSAPFDPASTVPDAIKGTGAPDLETIAMDWDQFSKGSSYLNPDAVDQLVKFDAALRRLPFFQKILDPEVRGASNLWAFARSLSATNNSMIANDPHLSLRMPSIFYPISIRGAAINAVGVGFPGAPLVVQGNTASIAWGSTVNPMDVTDMYQEQLVPDATSTSGFAVMYRGQRETLTAIPQTFRANVVGNGTNDDVNVVAPTATNGIPTGTLIVNRRGAPIVSLNAQTGAAVSVQYVGFGPTRELETFLIWNRAHSLDDFRRGLQFFDVGSQNWIYTDVGGNIAYFTSGEMPIREDLQAGRVEGLPPYFLRNGAAGGNDWVRVASRPAGQASSYEILPQSEMPSIVNPAGGWIVNANNDPAGTTLDNNPLNQLRTGGTGIYYLNYAYSGFRAGRITQMVRAKLARNEKFSVADMQNMQADVVLLDAQYFVPHILRALENAQASGANPALAQLASPIAVSGAVQALRTWDFSTPTGLPEGYDAVDVNGALSAPSQAEIQRSVAATIYSVWRGQMLKNTIDAVLGVGGLPRPGSQFAITALKNLFDNFATRGGAGASGVQFFNVPGIPNSLATADLRRDILILKSIADAVALLASDEFAPAFNKSQNLTDYRWGKLHRIVFAHPLGGPYNTPPAGGAFPAPLAGLTGIPVDGGFEVVDASSHNPRAATLNGFMFSSGPARRNVSEATTSGIRAHMALPGGPSGILGDALYINLLKPYLTNDYFQVGVQTGPTLPWGVR